MNEKNACPHIAMDLLGYIFIGREDDSYYVQLRPKRYVGPNSRYMSSIGDQMNECPICGHNLVIPTGPRDAKVLLIGERPGWEEIAASKPFVGATGDILRSELGRLEVDLWMLRLTNLWLHAPPSDEEQYEKCLQFCLQQALVEIKGKKAILLIGSDTVSLFCDEKVSDVCGLVVKSNYIDRKVLVMACVNPAIAFHRAPGEMRLALKKFCEKIKTKGYYD